MKKLFSFIIVRIVVVSILFIGINTVYYDDYVMASTDFAPSDSFNVENHYYKIFDEKVSWNEAKQKCEAMGGHLATITSEAEQSVVNYYNKSRKRLWIGAYRDDKYIWYWVTGEKFVYTNWCDGEPNNSSNVISNEDCVSLWSDGWNDLNNNSAEQSGYLCEWDNGESFSWKYNYPYGALELDGHHYMLYNEKLTFSEAKKKCQSLGGHLVTINSEKEQRFLSTKINVYNERVWIGGYRDNKDNWYWITGEAWKYKNWDDGEPNNSNNVISNENRAAMWPHKWNDLNENSLEQNGFICEWESKNSGVTGFAPTKTKIKTVTCKQQNVISVFLNRNNKASGYIVQCSASPKFTAKATKQIVINKNKKIHVTFNNLEPGKVYYIRVRTTKKAKSCILYSEWSSISKIKVKKK